MADMDVQLQIEETFAALNFDLVSKHVKGHQDDKRNIETQNGMENQHQKEKRKSNCHGKQN
eukprot:13069470-Ditylum_brightwellii.AAC.1